MMTRPEIAMTRPEIAIQMVLYAFWLSGADNTNKGAKSRGKKVLALDSCFLALKGLARQPTLSSRSQSQ
jgi:hypothetical protein